MAVAKVTINGTTILDLTDATAAADKIMTPDTAYGHDGSKLTGTIINGNNLSYGITDGTIPKAGIAKADYAEIGV